MVADKPTKTCERCGNPTRLTIHRYCSPKCFQASRKKQRRCKRCDAPIRTGLDYCSYTCMADARTKARPPCEYCGRPKHLRRARFCSTTCFAAWKIAADPTPTFWRQVNKTHTCWLWAGHHDGRGYGALTVHGKTTKAHRFAWEMANGPIPEGLDCCHVCDVKRCVRVDHLFLGTAKNNIDDMIQKGRQRQVRGEQSGTAKLTDEAVRVIRCERAKGVKLAPLARRYGVSMTVISGVATRKLWRHVQDHGSPDTAKP